MTHQAPFALSIAEACRLAGVQKDSIYRAINSGELISLKIGRRRLIRPESLQSWIQNKEKQTQEAGTKILYSNDT